MTGFLNVNQSNTNAIRYMHKYFSWLSHTNTALRLPQRSAAFYMKNPPEPPSTFSQIILLLDHLSKFSMTLFDQVARDVKSERHCVHFKSDL